MALMYKTDDPYWFEEVDEDVVSVRRRRGWCTVTTARFAKRIKKLRKAADLSQKEMSRFIRSRCSYSFRLNMRKYQRWEQGESLKRFLTVQNLYAVSQALSVPITFFTRRNPSKPDLWHANSVLICPTRPQSDEVAWGRALTVYKIEASVRGKEDVFFVIAGDRTDARRVFLDDVPGGEIYRVQDVEWRPGVLQ